MRIAVLMAVTLTAAWPQTAWISRPQPVDARSFPLMGWNESPSDPEQLRLMKEAGLNISGFCRVQDLERVARAGLTCVVDDKRANGFDWEKLPDDGVLRQQVQELIRQTRSKTAVLGYLLRDEPSTDLMPGLGRMSAMLREADPKGLTYVNLFPTYASQAQLGAATYEDYVNRFVKSVHPQFLSYDNYSLLGGVMADRFFTNLDAIRRAALGAGVPFWNCILANAHFHYMEPSDATLGLQVYSTLAYGGKGIQYFTYLTPNHGNFRLGAIDQFGNRTATWDMLRRIDNQIAALAPVMTKLKSLGVYHAPNVPDGCRPVSESRLVRGIDFGRASGDPELGQYLVGEFEDPTGRPYLMIVNKDLTRSFPVVVHLKAEGKKMLYVSPYSGHEQAFEGEVTWIGPGAGILLRVE